MSFSGDRPANTALQQTLTTTVEPPYMAWFHESDNSNALHKSAQSIHEHAQTSDELLKASALEGAGNAPWAQDLQQRRMAVREARFGGPVDTAQSLPKFEDVAGAQRSNSSDGAVSLAIKPAETVALKDAAPLQAERTAVKSVDMTDTQPLSLNQDEKESRAWALLKGLRDPNSLTSQKLDNLGLLKGFDSPNCHEHLSWGNDSVSVALKSETGYRRTIVSYFDQTTSERATDPKGNLLYTLSRSGKLIDNSDRAAKLQA